MKLTKPLPPVKDITLPNEAELDVVVAKWNANCPPYYKGLMEAGRDNSKFIYDVRTAKYMDKNTGRVLTRKEINKAFIAYSQKVAGK